MMDENTARDPKRYRDAVLRVLQRHPGLSGNALYRHHTRMPHRHLNEALRELEARGLVTYDAVPTPCGTVEKRWRPV